MPYEASQAYHIRAPPADVFGSLTEPQRLVQWFLSGAKIEPRTGGSFAFDWLQGYHMDGKVLECRPPSTVKFLWRDTTPEGKVVETEVAFHVTGKDGGSLLEMHHSGFTDPEHFAECASRWAYYLMNLKSQLEHKNDLRSPMDW